MSATEITADNQGQCVPGDGFPRTRSQDFTGGHGGTLSTIGDQVAPASNHISRRVPAQQLDLAPGLENLESLDEQPRANQNRRFRHGTILWRSAPEAHPTGRHAMVSSPRTPARRRNVRPGDRPVERRLHLRRAPHQRPPSPRQKRSRPAIQGPSPPTLQLLPPP